MRSFYVMALACLFSLPAWAEELTLYTGQKTATYYAIGRDLAALPMPKNLHVTVKESEGSVDNIRWLSGDGSGLGIVQSDVPGFLSRSPNSALRRSMSRLRVVFPLYQEEVHVLAQDGIEGFKNLEGKKVAVGEEGSGGQLTADNLFAIAKVKPASVKSVTPEEGIVAVLKGEIDAVIFVGGKPVKIFKNMEDLTRPENQRYAMLLQHVHFLGLNDIAFYREYEPAEITPRDYKFVKSTVPTVAVQAMLVSYAPATPASDRCPMLRAFAASFKENLPLLKSKGHPKWQEVNVGRDTPGWQKDPCVWHEAGK